MAAYCKKASYSGVVAIGVVLVALVGLGQVQEAEAARVVAVINLSTVPLNVTVRVNASVVGSVVVRARANVDLPLLDSVGVNAVANITVTNLLTNSSGSALVTLVDDTTTLVIAPVLGLVNAVTVAVGTLLGGLFDALTLLFTLL